MSKDHKIDWVPNVNRMRRGGFTLMEMTMIMPAISILLVIAISWASQSMDFTKRIRHRQHHHRALHRLASDCRMDVSGAARVGLENNHSLQIASHNGNQIHYEIAENQLTKKTREGGRLIARENYRLAPTSRAFFVATDSPDQIKLIVHRVSDVTDSLNFEQVAATGKLEFASDFQIRGWNDLAAGEPQ